MDHMSCGLVSHFQGDVLASEIGLPGQAAIRGSIVLVTKYICEMQMPG